MVMDIMNFGYIAVQTAGITMHGTGFDREVLPLSLAVILFAVWMGRGAPMPGRIFDGVVGLFVVGLIALAVLFGCSPDAFGTFGDMSSGAFVPISVESSDEIGKIFGWIDLIVPFAAIGLFFALPPGKHVPSQKRPRRSGAVAGRNRGREIRRSYPLEDDDIAFRSSLRNRGRENRRSYLLEDDDIAFIPSLRNRGREIRRSYPRLRGKQ